MPVRLLSRRMRKHTMTSLAIRPISALSNVNWGKVLLFTVLFLYFTLAFTHPAFAFGEVESKLTSQTKAATGVAQKVLLTAAVLALIIGIAPMLWGQIKTKWIITCGTACVLFGLASAFVTAFAS